jgi:hypothetical protein
MAPPVRPKQTRTLRLKPPSFLGGFGSRAANRQFSFLALSRIQRNGLPRSLVQSHRVSLPALRLSDRYAYSVDLDCTRRSAAADLSQGGTHA